MTKRDGAAVDVEAVGLDLQLTLDGHDLCGERLVDLNEGSSRCGTFFRSMLLGLISTDCV